LIRDEANDGDKDEVKVTTPKKIQGKVWFKDGSYY